MTRSETTRVALLEQNMEQNKNDHLEIKELICELKKDFKAFKSDADQRYAPKWVATLVYGLVGGVGLFIIQSLLKSAGLQ